MRPIHTWSTRPAAGDFTTEHPKCTEDTEPAFPKRAELRIPFFHFAPRPSAGIVGFCRPLLLFHCHRGTTFLLRKTVMS